MGLKDIFAPRARLTATQVVEITALGPQARRNLRPGYRLDFNGTKPYEIVDVNKKKVWLRPTRRSG